MKHRPIILLLVLVVGLGAAAPAPKGGPAAPVDSSLASLPASPLVSRMKQVRAMLDDVFKIHEAGATQPDFRQNPFRFPGAVPETTSGQTPNPASVRASRPGQPETDSVRLRRLATSLSVGFLEKLGAQPMVSVGGSAAVKEGGAVTVTDPLNNTRVTLRIRKISGRSVTFGLNSAEFTVTK